MGTLTGLYLFGSNARGDSDASSDLDILAVYDEQPEVSFRKRIMNSVRAKFGDRVTLAEYSTERLAGIFDSGHLFAWHLYQEAKPVQISGLISQQVSLFRPPAPYDAGIKDAMRFIDLLSSVANEVQDKSCSLVHEAGLAYLALRNIAMSLSIKLQKRADFTRYSPLNISTSLAIRPPCSATDFEVLVAARHASQRGLSSPSIDRSDFRCVIDHSLEWAHAILEKAHE
ncbi:MAG: nucleotidyltransferase domain-containing protein [Gallionella sp.]